MLRKIFSGIVLALLLNGMLIVKSDTTLPATTSQQIQLETDKHYYELGESVTITLTNIGYQLIYIPQDPPWIIYTYPDNELVYPKFPQNDPWPLEPSESKSWSWNQVNEYESRSAEPGNYVIKDTQNWGLSVYFSILSSYTVPDNYEKIQDAIDASSDKGTIYVRNGTYNECILINKPLRIVGENKENTTINGLDIPVGHVVQIRSSDVSLYNFTIRHPDAHPHHGISIGHTNSFVRNINISGNRIINCDQGIFIMKASDINIECNEFERDWINSILCGQSSGIRIRIINNTISLEEGLEEEKNWENSVGIHVDGSKNSTFRGNKIKNIHVGIETSGDNGSTYVYNELCQCSTGIGIKNGLDNFVGYNLMYDNDLCISLDESPDNNVTCNEIFENPEGTGIKISHSENNTVIGNTLESTKSGIQVIYSVNNSILDNYLYNCSQACELEDSEYNLIEANVIQACSFGISTDDGSTNNTICRNDFFDNNESALELGTNCWKSNYWSDYEGGELPHHKDNCPLNVPIGPIPVYFEETMYFCNIDGNMTMSRFSAHEEETLSFNVTGEGYINLTIPRKLLDGQFKVVIDNEPLPCILWWNDTHTLIWFTYDEEGTHNVKVVADISTKTPSESPDISMKLDVGPSFTGNYNLTVPRTFLDGQFRIIVNDVTIPSILYWNKTHTSIYFAYSEENFHNVRIVAKNSIIQFPDTNADGAINILDLAHVAMRFGETLED